MRNRTAELKVERIRNVVVAAEQTDLYYGHPDSPAGMANRAWIKALKNILEAS